MTGFVGELLGGALKHHASSKISKGQRMSMMRIAAYGSDVEGLNMLDLNHEPETAPHCL